MHRSALQIGWGVTKGWFREVRKKAYWGPFRSRPKPGDVCWSQEHEKSFGVVMAVTNSLKFLLLRQQNQGVARDSASGRVWARSPMPGEEADADQITLFGSDKKSNQRHFLFGKCAWGQRHTNAGENDLWLADTLRPPQKQPTEATIPSKPQHLVTRST